jgi:hypothetical protein
MATSSTSSVELGAVSSKRTAAVTVPAGRANHSADDVKLAPWVTGIGVCASSVPVLS